MSEQICVSFRNEYSSQQNYTPSFLSSSKNVALKRSSDALPNYGKAPESSVTDLLNKSAGYNITSVIAELEKRRARYFAQARAAEARAREAEEKYEQAESRLEQETYQRLVAEQRLREFEDDRLRQLNAVEIERAKTLEAVVAHGEARALLKKAERRIIEAENDATSLTIALAKAYQKRDEAEATARAATEKAHVIESLFLRSEPGDHEAIKGQLVFGLLIFASRRKMLKMERGRRNVEARHRQQENGLENILQKQTSKLRSIPEKALLAEGAFTTLNLSKSVDDDHACRAPEQKGLGTKLKFIIYGTVITLLVGMCWGLITAFLQI